MIRTILNYLPIGFCGAVSFFGFYRFAKNGFTIEKFKNAIKNGKKVLFIICVTGIAGATLIIGSYLQNRNYASYNLKYVYDGADEGLYPNGQWLNASDIICDDILSAAAKKLGIEEKEIDDALYISSSLDSASLNTSDPQIASEYTIGTTKNIGDVDAEKLIIAAAESYADYFMKNYTEQSSSLEVNLEDIDEMDYDEASELLEKEAKKIKNFLSSYKWNNTGYSDEEKQNFSSLIKSVDNFIDVELSSYNSYIIENGITKDAEEYKETIEYKNRLLQKDYDKDMASYKVLLEAIDMYNSDLTSVVLVPTEDSDGNFYMSRTKIGTDYYATDASNYSSNAASTKEEMDENEYKLDKIKTSTTERTKKADEKLEQLKTDLTVLAESAKSFFDEFTESKRDGYIKISYNQNSLKNTLDVKHNFILTAITGLMLAIAEVCKKTERYAK